MQKLGGAVPSSVTKTLTHLVVGGSGRDAPSTKQKAAQKLLAEGAAIAVLSEQDFEALLAPLEVAASPTASPAPSGTKQQLTLF